MAGNTKFRDMPQGSLNGWIAWANSHDWGGEREARFDRATGELVTYGSEHDGTEWRTIEARHKTPAEMKAWAGY